ncbi:acyltransferase [Furfurilactobacillus curtus]|uniref:Acyltransferase 3 domain-containing protein n=1 Tax=Furfurilactobacillus curtus TaxID=1746200 RepID=A0ABQ5JNJ1_9LACO
MEQIDRTKVSKRIVGLDLIRVIAIFLVLLSHAIPANTHPNTLSVGGQIINATFVSIGHLGVPIFFMLSGYFLIDRDYETTSAINWFYRHKVAPMAICFVLWISIYQLFLWGVLHRSLTLMGWLEDLLFFSRQGGNPNGLGIYIWNAWFMPAILGLYLAVPFISRAVYHFPRRGLWWIYLLVVSQTMVMPTATLLLNAFGKPGFSISQLDLSYFGGISATYFFAGYLIKTSQRQWSKWLLMISGVTLAVAIWLTQYQFQFTDYAKYTGGQLEMPYQFLLLLPCAAAFVQLAARWHQSTHQWLNQGMAYLSGLSFGVFLCHRLISIALDKTGWLTGQSLTKQTLLNMLILLAGGYLIAMIIHKIPWLDRWLLLNH